MGSYTDFRCGGFALITTKSYVDPVLMTVFRETDKAIKDPEPDADETVTVAYRISVGSAKMRLRIMGFSLERTIANFEKAKAERIANITGYIDQLQEWNFDQETHEQMRDEETAILDLVKRSSFQDFLDGFRFLKTQPLEARYSDVEKRKMPQLVRFMLSDEAWESDSPAFNYPCNDIRYLVRAFLETCSNDGEFVEQDLTEVVSAGYYEADDNIAAESLESLLAEHPTSGKVIILTEGSTDVSILSRTLELLHPELADFFSFMDFATSNAPGRTAKVVDAVKAFVAAGISNRVVALFDNDSAAEDAIRFFSKVDLPSNIKVLRLPDTALAANYPTIGPSGSIEKLNVNGRACSIEMYFGRDVLRGDDGSLTPIQWKGFKEGVKKYQGEVQNKKLLQDRFSQKIEKCEQHPDLTGQYDFNEMRQVFDTIFAAFG